MMGLSPAKKLSTAMIIKMSPMRRSKTLLPLGPIKLSTGLEPIKRASEMPTEVAHSRRAFAQRPIELSPFEALRRSGSVHNKRDPERRLPSSILIIWVLVGASPTFVRARRA